jgi:hypothetical protein
VFARETSAIKPKDLPRLKDWTPAVAREGFLNSEECDGIVALRDELEPGKVTGEDEVRSHRKCMVSWIEPTPGNRWVFQKTGNLVAQVNNSLYQLDLFGFTERLQFTLYETGHFTDWHLDMGPDRYSVRKLTFTIQLSDACQPSSRQTPSHARRPTTLNKSGCIDDRAPRSGVGHRADMIR